MKPANAGFLRDNKLANEIITLDTKTLKMKNNMKPYPKKFFILDIGFLKGSYTLSMNSM